MKTIAFFLTMLVPAIVFAQETPTVGYAPVNGLKMYYEVHGSGEPVVLLHGAYMTILGNWTGWIGELSKTRKVIAVEMQGHGRTADIKDRRFNNFPIIGLDCITVARTINTSQRTHTDDVQS
jgi:pimeloyl-ACP methyl ester carboxylesterase